MFKHVLDVFETVIVLIFVFFICFCINTLTVDFTRGKKIYRNKEVLNSRFIINKMVYNVIFCFLLFFKYTNYRKIKF